MAVREGRIGYEEAGRFLRFYEDGLQGYTYLEEAEGNSSAAIRFPRRDTRTEPKDSLRRTVPSGARDLPHLMAIAASEAGVVENAVQNHDGDR